MTAASTDPGLLFLERAAARLMLVKACEMNVETAVGELVEPFEQLVGPLLCDCACDIVGPVGARLPTPAQAQMSTNRALKVVDVENDDKLPFKFLIREYKYSMIQMLDECA